MTVAVFVLYGDTMTADGFPVQVRLIAGVLRVDSKAADPLLYLVTAYPADAARAVLQQSIQDLGDRVGDDERELLGRGLSACQVGLVYNRLVQLLDERMAGSQADTPPLAVARLEYASNLLRVVFPQKFVRPLKVVEVQ